MSISGKVADVSVAEVMQFIHLGRRSGSLVVESDDKKAEIGFHRGRIISAVEPKSPLLGKLLMDRGFIGKADLVKAIHLQQVEKPRQSLGRILLAMNVITEEQIRSAVAEQIEVAICEVITWKGGTFEFNLDEMRPVDDVGVSPGEILPEINLDTQMVVLEALRIFDERNRRQEAEGHPDGTDYPGSIDAPQWPDPGAGSSPPSFVMREAADESAESAGEFEDPLAELAQAGLEGSPAESPLPAQSRIGTRLALGFHLITQDEALIEGLKEVLPDTLRHPVEVSLSNAGFCLPGESPPIVLVDLRRQGVGLEDISELCRARPRATVVAIESPSHSAAEIYEAGALAALPPSVETIAAFAESVVRRHGDAGTTIPLSGVTASGFAKLQRVITDLGSGLLYTTVALNLMSVISESVERAIMFLAQRDVLAAVGAFGFGSEGTPLAEVTKGFEMERDTGGVLSASAEDGQARTVQFQKAHLPQGLSELLGAPCTGQSVIFPVLGNKEVIAVIYTDNGHLDREIEEIEILELAAAQVGVAYENELLRRKAAS